VYANGNVFTRDFFGNLILNAATGTLQSMYAGVPTPAVDATTIYTLNPPTLYAQNLNGGQTKWTFNGDGNLTSAPIVIQTATGELVIVGSTSGMLYALNAATGAQVWSANVGGAIATPDEHNAGNLAGLARRAGSARRPNGFSVSAYTGGGTGPTDTTPPTIKAPPGTTVEATGPSGAAVSYVVTASDPDDAPAQITLTCAPASGSTFALGTTTVTCNAHDAAGNNAAPATFPITVRDTTPPALSAPANMTVNATSPSGATVTYAPTATDLVDGSVPVTCTPASGSSFANGTTTVTCTAKDTRGNTASATFKVTVLSAAAQLSALKSECRSPGASGHDPEEAARQADERPQPGGTGRPDEGVQGARAVHLRRPGQHVAERADHERPLRRLDRRCERDPPGSRLLRPRTDDLVGMVAHRWRELAMRRARGRRVPRRLRARNLLSKEETE
jgi:hypothetical protein